MAAWLTVVETAPYLAAARSVLSEAEREAIVDLVARDPTIGEMMPGTGGLRKFRVPASGRGKRGGGRVVTFFHDETMPIFLISFYTKATQVYLDADQRKRVRSITEAIRREYGRRA